MKIIIFTRIFLKYPQQLIIVGQLQDLVTIIIANIHSLTYSNISTIKYY